MNNETVPRLIFSMFMAVSSAAYMIIGPHSVGDSMIGLRDTKADLLMVSLVSAITSIVAYIIWKGFFNKKIKLNIKSTVFYGISSGAICTVISAISYLVIFDIYAVVTQGSFNLITFGSFFLMLIFGFIALLFNMLPIALLYGVSGGLLYGVVHMLYKYKKVT